jgi:hypothetical protein
MPIKRQQSPSRSSIGYKETNKNNTFPEAPDAGEDASKIESVCVFSENAG